MRSTSRSCCRGLSPVRRGAAPSEIRSRTITAAFSALVKCRTGSAVPSGSINSCVSPIVLHPHISRITPWISIGSAG